MNLQELTAETKKKFHCMAIIIKKRKKVKIIQTHTE